MVNENKLSLDKDISAINQTIMKIQGVLKIDRHDIESVQQRAQALEKERDSHREQLELIRKDIFTI